MQFHKISFLAVASMAAGMAQIADTVAGGGADRFAAAGRDAVAYNSPRTRVSMYIWSDKYVYQAGQPLTLKWTVKTNGDLYPYNMFVFRQNNQTGRKTYLPAGTEEATDVNGNNAATGFQPAPPTAAAKATLIGAGGRFPGETRTHRRCLRLRKRRSRSPRQGGR